MKLNRIAALAAATLFSSTHQAVAQSVLPLKHAPRPTQPQITTDDLKTRVYIFADDSMKGRRAGSEGDMRGTAYIERELRRLGLKPAGDSGTFFQAVPMFNLSLDTESKLTADETPVVAGVDYFPIHPTGIPRSVDGVQVVYVGNTTDTSTALSPAQAAGKIVLFTGPTAGVARRYSGAVAYMVPRADAQMGQIRAYTAGITQHLRSDDDSVSRPLTIYVPMSSVQKFLGVPLENARAGTLGRTLHGEIRYRVENLPTRNVVGIIPGSDASLRNQYVALGAHSDHEGVRRAGPLDHDSLRAFNEAAARVYIARTGKLPSLPGSGISPGERAAIELNLDSIRRARPARLDSIFNGADDDASGSMGLLEVAEKFASASVKPKRSLLFVWHTAEEAGLYGAEWFTDNPTVPRDSIVAQITIDMIGRGESTDIPGGSPQYLQLLGSRRLSTEYGNIIEEVNRSGSNGFELDYTFDANGHPEQYYCRSDHYQYARYGIPVVFMSTGGHRDYHQVTDEPQYISYPHLAKVTNFVADVAERVANLGHRVVIDKPKPDPRAPCVQ